MTEDSGRRAYLGDWQPSPRPEWVARINAEGACLDMRAVVPLDENSLLAWARANTGLTDFGEDDWYEPFQVFLKSLDEEANLHLMGRLMARADILNLLEARLQIEHAFKVHPEIAEEQIVRPFVVVGQGRSGTTAMLNLLAADPRVASLRQWETMFPWPPPRPETYASDPRIAKADAMTMQQVRVTPEFGSMHVIGGAPPRECTRAHALSFRSPAYFNVIGQCPSYSRYMAGQDMAPAYRYQKRLMQLLQWQHPRERWVLKTPVHLDMAPQLFATFPDACVIWLHRDPIRAMASQISILGTWQWQRSDTPFASDVWDFLGDPQLAGQRLERVIDWLEDGTVPADQFYHILYKDFVADRIGTVARIYDRFGFSLPDEPRRQLEAFIARNPRDARPPHQYSVGSDEDIARVRPAFQRYQDYFGVPSE